MPNINGILANMRRSGKMQDNTAKGDLGEDAVLAICYERKLRVKNGLLYNSFKYPYQTDRSGVCYTGNIKYEDGKYVEYTRDTLYDEIDVLYVTPYRVFAIEVKSYHARKINVYDHWVNRNGQPVDKSPVAQVEKHVRHLYHAIYDVLPDGDPSYIIPIVCFVDKCTVVDERCNESKTYVPVCILNTLLKTINMYNTPNEYNLDLEVVKSKLQQLAVSIKRTL